MSLVFVLSVSLGILQSPHSSRQGTPIDPKHLLHRELHGEPPTHRNPSTIPSISRSGSFHVFDPPEPRFYGCRLTSPTPLLGHPLPGLRPEIESPPLPLPRPPSRQRPEPSERYRDKRNCRVSLERTHLGPVNLRDNSRRKSDEFFLSRG